MKKSSGNPWNFHLAYPSPDNQHKIEYQNVGEIAMSAPHGGSCILYVHGKKYEPDAHFGGPALWNSESDKIAIPLWTRSRNQKLAIIDIKKMTLAISAKNFRVIQLEDFQENLISGIDSPIYKTEKIEFELELEDFEQVLDIK